MRIIRTKRLQQMSRDAANIISAQVILKPNSVLGWPPAPASHWRFTSS